MKIKNPYALINNTLVHVSDERITSGNGELYICPDKFCKEPLYARKGSIKSYHFAHKSGINCNGLESSLHLKAKEIIEDLDSVFIPKYRVWAGDVLRRFHDDIFKIESNFKYPLYTTEFENLFLWNTVFDYDEFCLFPDVCLNLKNYNIESEVLLDGHKPDIKLLNKKTNESLYIEIAVTSFVNNDKKRLIKEQNLSVLEIDLSSFYKSDEYSSFNSSELEEFLKLVFTIGDNLKNTSYFYDRRPRYNWVNLKNESKLIENRMDKFVEIWKKELEIFYKYYSEVFIPIIDSYKYRLELMSIKEIAKELTFWNKDYQIRESILKSNGMLNHFLRMYKKTDLFKLTIKKKDEKKESVQDFIKRMTS